MKHGAGLFDALNETNIMLRSNEGESRKLCYASLTLYFHFCVRVIPGTSTA